jgi:hypothetical protein
VVDVVLADTETSRAGCRTVTSVVQPGAAPPVGQLLPTSSDMTVLRMDPPPTSGSFVVSV